MSLDILTLTQSKILMLKEILAYAEHAFKHAKRKKKAFTLLFFREYFREYWVNVINEDFVQAIYFLR